MSIQNSISASLAQDYGCKKRHAIKPRHWLLSIFALVFASGVNAQPTGEIIFVTACMPGKIEVDNGTVKDCIWLALDDIYKGLTLRDLNPKYAPRPIWLDPMTGRENEFNNPVTEVKKPPKKKTREAKKAAQAEKAAARDCLGPGLEPTLRPSFVDIEDSKGVVKGYVCLRSGTGTAQDLHAYDVWHRTQYDQNGAVKQTCIRPQRPDEGQTGEIPVTEVALTWTCVP